jgi:hypothetical protein
MPIPIPIRRTPILEIWKVVFFKNFKIRITFRRLKTLMNDLISRRMFFTSRLLLITGLLSLFYGILAFIISGKILVSFSIDFWIINIINIDLLSIWTCLIMFFGLISLILGVIVWRGKSHTRIMSSLVICVIILNLVGVFFGVFSFTAFFRSNSDYFWSLNDLELNFLNYGMLFLSLIWFLSLLMVVGINCFVFYRGNRIQGISQDIEKSI